MTPQDQVKDAKTKLSLSSRELGLALEVPGDPGRNVRKWMSGEIRVPGPAIVALRYMVRHGLDRHAKARIAGG